MTTLMEVMTHRLRAASNKSVWGGGGVVPFVFLLEVRLIVLGEQRKVFSFYMSESERFQSTSLQRD